MMYRFATPPRQLGGSQPSRAPVFSEEHCRAHLGSEERSQDLLRQWLSPDQVEQYDLYLYFVVDSATGARYRTRRGTAMNIEELAADGCVTRRWCFAPEGTFATGDVMLTRKIHQGDNFAATVA
jgi:hypothetical protein